MPNVGKSTLFNALTRLQVPVASYPFTTIEPHTGVVAVPDERLEKLAKVERPEQVLPTTIAFVDIAGLVKEAHQGKGLGNQFLSHIREVDALVEVVRLFEDESVAHVEGALDPARDIKIIAEELAAAEIEKPILYVANTDKTNLGEIKIADQPALAINLKTGAGLAQLIQQSYKLLDLITFFSRDSKTIQAWTVRRGSKAPQAAGRIHTDFEQGFIKADVAAWDKLVAAGGWQKAKEKGLIRTEGKDYVVQDGDIVHFKFNV